MSEEERLQDVPEESRSFSPVSSLSPEDTASTSNSCNPAVTSSASLDGIDGLDEPLDVDIEDVRSALIGEDQDSNTAPFCRICFEGGGGISEPLIAPCQCKGTQKYVHRSCLDNWRASKEGFAFAHCTECRAAFLLKAQMPADRKWRTFQFRTCVAIDHTVLFCGVQLLVAALTTLAYYCFGAQLREQLGYTDQPGSFLFLVVIVSIAVGVLYGFFIGIICSDNIERRHAPILRKQALTKEFQVEDLDCSVNHSWRSLAPEHEQELASLGLL